MFQARAISATRGCKSSKADADSSGGAYKSDAPSCGMPAHENVHAINEVLKGSNEGGDPGLRGLNIADRAQALLR